LVCCNNSHLKDHINNVATINSNIIEYFDELIKKENIYNYNVSDDEISKLRVESFNHKITINDTTIYLDYKLYNSEESCSYKHIHLTKEYKSRDKYHVIEIFNNDTLYHYSSLKPMDKSQFYEDYNFILGKYFFMATHNSGFLNEQQMIYFFLNADSLINVRGNDLPGLPSVDSISLKDFYDSDIYRRIVAEESFFQ
jgi:hypothetical protein